MPQHSDGSGSLGHEVVEMLVCHLVLAGSHVVELAEADVPAEAGGFFQVGLLSRQGMQLGRPGIHDISGELAEELAELEDCRFRRLHYFSGLSYVGKEFGLAELI